MDFSREFQSTLRICRIISLTILVSLGIYATLGQWLLKPMFSEPLTPSYPQLRIILAVLAFLQIVFTRSLLGGILQRRFLNGQSDKTADKTYLLAFLRTEHIIRCVLFEAVGIYGLLLFFIGGGNTSDLFFMCLVSAVLILLDFPRTQAWQDKINRLPLG